MKKLLSLALLCMIPLGANIVSVDDFSHFVHKQKKKANRYKNKPLVIISKASWLLGYGSVSKDDLFLMDRLPSGKHDLRTLMHEYQVDEALSRERVERWKRNKYKRAAVINELREYTAMVCGCSTRDAYGMMRDAGRINNEKYYTIVLQNLHDLRLFIKTVEKK